MPLHHFIISHTRGVEAPVGKTQEVTLQDLAVVVTAERNRGGHADLIGPFLKAFFATLAVLAGLALIAAGLAGGMVHMAAGAAVALVAWLLNGLAPRRG